jgi:hypothetical protein
MAKFKAEIPNDLMQEFEGLERDCGSIFGEMVEAGARVVHKNVLANMKKSFNDTAPLEKGLRVTKIYKTPSDDGVNVHIGFYGYDSDKKTKKHPNGVPIPLMAMAREYGTKSGERKKPFLRKSFKKTEIEQAMSLVQEKYIPKGD